MVGAQFFSSSGRGLWYHVHVPCVVIVRGRSSKCAPFLWRLLSFLYWWYMHGSIAFGAWMSPSTEEPPLFGRTDGGGRHQIKESCTGAMHKTCLLGSSTKMVLRPRVPWKSTLILKPFYQLGICTHFTKIEIRDFLIKRQVKMII